MVPSINTILCGVDLSENSEKAFGYSVSLAEKFGAKLYLAHVVEPISASVHSQVSAFMGETQWEQLQLENSAKAFESVSQRLKSLCDTLGPTSSSCAIAADQVIVRKGAPFEELIALAGELNIDLVVVGSHGYGAVQDAFMGGTVRRLIRQTRIPVFVAR